MQMMQPRIHQIDHPESPLLAGVNDPIGSIIEDSDSILMYNTQKYGAFPRGVWLFSGANVSMARITKHNGHYSVHGKRFEELYGSRAQVWHGSAYKTSGGLTKSDLLQNNAGRIVSKSKHASARKEKRLAKAGYGTKKGHFGFVKTKRGGNYLSDRSLMHGKTTGGTRRRKRRGGNNMLPLSPHEISGITNTSGAGIQLLATNY